MISHFLCCLPVHRENLFFSLQPIYLGLVKNGVKKNGYVLVDKGLGELTPYRVVTPQ